jgi:hypothetical protein
MQETKDEINRSIDVPDKKDNHKPAGDSGV